MEHVSGNKSLHVRKIKWALPAVITLFMIGFTACMDSDDIGDNYYTFTGEVMGEYFAARPETYSEFSDLLERSEVLGLLNAYGKYTCFAPTNEAMYAYYESQGRSSLDDFPQDSLYIIAYDHIIKDYEVETDDFTQGFISHLTMSGRYISVSYDGGSSGIDYTINGSSLITSKNIEVHNGIIHQIDEVLNPTSNTLVEAINYDTRFSLFDEALDSTGLASELMAVKDESYEVPADMYSELNGTGNGIGGIVYVPKERKYGFTALIESDETFAANGINNLDDLIAYAKEVYDEVYPEDAGITDLTDRSNSLNRFVAYHLINKKIPKQYFLQKYDNTGSTYDEDASTHSIKTYDMYEYIETMCPNTLLEVRTLRPSEYDIFNMNEETGDAIRIADDNYDNDAINGVYHEIDGILTYSLETATMISSKKLRMDAASFFPELTNNSMRVGHESPDYNCISYKFPDGYIERVETDDQSTFGYINADDRFCDYQGDEVFLNWGLYDITITTPSIPAGTYEVRFGYLLNGSRGKVQLYWDGIPCGIPLDMNVSGTDASIGYETPGSDSSDPYGYENDKSMRNRGYMKAPATFKAISGSWQPDGAYTSARLNYNALRRILGIYTFTEAGSHTFRVKAAREGEFMFDYLEFVPTEVIDSEGID